MPVGDMRNPALPQDAQNALVLLDLYLQRFYPGCSVDVPIFRGVPGLPMDGFAVHHDGGMSLIYVDAGTAAGGGQWALQMCAVLAVDISDITGALLWANDRNRRSAIDRYYCAISPDAALCAVAAETTVMSPVLTDFMRPVNQAVVDLVRSLAKNTLYSAAEEPKDLLATRPGRRLGPDEHDLMTMVVVATG